MRLLLDTQLLLWALARPGNLPAEARAAIEDVDSSVFFSAASIWEIAIKAGLKRADFAVSPSDIAQAAVEDGFVELPIVAEVAVKVADLPAYHRDPFDRLLVAQAIAGSMRLYTADLLLPRYSELVMLVR